MKPILQCLGQVHLTQGIHKLLSDSPHLETQFTVRMKQYLEGDWGDTNYSEEDFEANNRTVEKQDGGRILAEYRLLDGTRIWISTNGYGNHKKGPDYCYSTVLLPSEY